jgi:NDP-sugar pyrophosphorylase family protein
MKAVLLAAGRGTRLGVLTETVPKILVPIGNRTLLERQLAFLAANGVTELAINLHHHADQVKALLARIETPLRVVTSEEAELLGTAGALVPLREFLDERFIVLYGDVLTDAPLAQLVATHDAAHPLATLACYESTEVADKGIVQVDDVGRIVRFDEKAASTGRALVNAGIYVCEPAVVDLVGVTPEDFGHDVWPRALAAGHELRAFAIAAYLRDVGTPQALSAAEADVRMGSVGW